jgi:hypothetical protein
MGNSSHGTWLALDTCLVCSSTWDGDHWCHFLEIGESEWPSGSVQSAQEKATEKSK